MKPQSLFQSSLKIVTESIVADGYQVRANMSIPIRQQVFDEILKNLPSDLPRNFDIRQFNISEARLTKFFMTRNMIRQLSECDLKVLEINCNIPGYRVTPDFYFDIARMIGSCLNQGSRQKMVYLVIHGNMRFQDNWMNRLLEMVPNLTTLVRKGSLEATFPRLAGVFPKLTNLDLSHSRIRNLRGIQNLPNLKDLNLRNMVYDDAADIQELYLLPNLRVLDVSLSQNDRRCRTMAQLVEHGNRFPALEEIDCSNTFLPPDVLTTFLDLNQDRLKTMCIYNTIVERLEIFPAYMNILRAIDLPSALRMLDHFMKKNRATMIYCALCIILFLLRHPMNYNENKALLHSCFDHVVKILADPSLKQFGNRETTFTALKCMDEYTRFYVEHLTSQQMESLIETLVVCPLVNSTEFWSTLCHEELLESVLLSAPVFYQKALDFISSFQFVSAQNVTWANPAVYAMATLFPRLTQEEKNNMSNVNQGFQGILTVLGNLCAMIVAHDDTTEEAAVEASSALRQILEGWNGEQLNHRMVYSSLLHLINSCENSLDIMHSILQQARRIQDSINHENLVDYVTLDNVRSLLVAACRDFSVPRNRNEVVLSMVEEALQIIANLITPAIFAGYKKHLRWWFTNFLRMKNWQDLHSPGISLVGDVEHVDLVRVRNPKEWAYKTMSRLKRYIRDINDRNTQQRFQRRQRFHRRRVNGENVIMNVQGDIIHQ